MTLLFPLQAAYQKNHQKTYARFLDKTDKYLEFSGDQRNSPGAGLSL